MTGTTQLLICFVCFLAIFTFGAESKKIDAQQLPPAVKQALDTHTRDSKVVGIEREDDEGSIIYSVKLHKTGKERELTFGEDGSLLGEEISFEEAPPEVQKTIKAQSSQGKVQRIEKSFETDELTYEVETLTKAGLKRSFSVAPDGKLKSLQISLEEAPAAARKTIQAHVGTGKLGDIYKVLEGPDVSYAAEVDHNGKKREVVVAADGQLESLEVGLADVTPEAQKTIKEKISNGKVLRIDKTFEGAQPYEIEALKDGKRFKFKVGPKGRFLGKE